MDIVQKSPKMSDFTGCSSRYQVFPTRNYLGYGSFAYASRRCIYGSDNISPIFPVEGRSDIREGIFDLFSLKKSYPDQLVRYISFDKSFFQGPRLEIGSI